MIAPHSTRTFVEQLDFRTTRATARHTVITDLGVLEPARGGELTLTSPSRGEPEQVRETTGWELRWPIAGGIRAADRQELAALRELVSTMTDRTRRHAETEHRP